MQRFLKLCRFLLPATFLGYSLIANINFLQTGDLRVDLDQVAFLKGRVASEIDTAYVDSLPHREISVGLIGAARYVLIGEGRSGVITGDNGWLFTQEEAGPFGGDLDTAAAEINTIGQRLRQHGTQLILVPVPGKLDVYSRFSGDLSPEIRGVYDGFLAALDRQAIAHIDIRPVLLQGNSTQQTFLSTDTHWTPFGATAVARAIANAELIPQGDADYFRRAQVEKTLTGDLVSFVTSDVLAPIVGLRPEVIIPFDAVSKPDANISIFGADSIDTVLIGTSYSANTDWSFAEALKLLLSRDVLNLATEGQGPVAPMRAYLNSPELAASAPRYVIWEFPVRYLSDPDLWQSHDAQRDV
ncbi:MAG: hypothetical protein GKR99_12550 [Rhodobacteraceae bacterium]|nr:hypothetical protein [Paracoccaceae bacterium]